MMLGITCVAIVGSRPSYDYELTFATLSWERMCTLILKNMSTGCQTPQAPRQKQRKAPLPSPMHQGLAHNMPPVMES